MSSRPPFIPVNIKKRKFDEAFASETFEDTRYGQHISAEFFVKNTADQQVVSPSRTFTVQEADEILEWCAYYLANRNLFNV